MRTRKFANSTQCFVLAAICDTRLGPFKLREDEASSSVPALLDASRRRIAQSP